MISHKCSNSDATIYHWQFLYYKGRIDQNKYGYNINGQALKMFTMHNFTKVLQQFRQYVYNSIQNQSSLLIPQIGLLFRSSQSKDNKIKIKYNRSIMLVLFVKQQSQQIFGNLPKQITIDYEQVAGSCFLAPLFAELTIKSYIKACIELSVLEPDRKTIINLGPITLQIHKKRISEVYAQTRDKRKTKISFLKAINSINQSKIWLQSAMGTLEDRLHITHIQANLDRGAVTTGKFLKALERLKQSAE